MLTSAVRVVSATCVVALLVLLPAAPAFAQDTTCTVGQKRNTLGHTWLDEYGTMQKYNYHINNDSVMEEFGNGAIRRRALARIRRAFNTWSVGRNRCDLDPYRRFTADEKDFTERSARSNGDEVNVIDFGVIDSNSAYNDCPGNQGEDNLIACVWTRAKPGEVPRPVTTDP